MPDPWVITGQTASDWASRNPETIDFSAIATTLTDFPVAVFADNSDPNLGWNGTVQADGDDVVFVLVDGTVLDFEIEYFDSAGVSVFHVEVPSITGGSTTEYFYMYWGNSIIAVSLQDAAGTWDASTNARYAMSEGSGNILDSTANGNTGTPTGTMTYGATGQVDGAVDDIDLNDGFNIGQDASLRPGTGDFCVSWWMNYDSSLTQRVATRTDDSLSNTGWVRIDYDNRPGWGSSGFATIRFDVGQTGGGALQRLQITGVAIAENTWQHWAFRRNSNVLEVFRNGASIGSGAVSSTDISSAVNWHIGNTKNYNEGIKGGFDDYRVQIASRSSDWIAAEYLSGLGSLTTIGEQQSYYAAVRSRKHRQSQDGIFVEEDYHDGISRGHLRRNLPGRSRRIER